MTKNTNMSNLKRLLDLGKDKGYITYDDLNGDIPRRWSLLIIRMISR